MQSVQRSVNSGKAGIVREMYESVRDFFKPAGISNLSAF